MLGMLGALGVLDVFGGNFGSVEQDVAVSM